MNTTRNTCVYTVLVGDYETLNEQPVAAASALQPVQVSAAQQAAVVEYISGRLEQLVAEQGVQVSQAHHAVAITRDGSRAHVEVTLQAAPTTDPHNWTAMSGGVVIKFV